MVLWRRGPRNDGGMSGGLNPVEVVVPGGNEGRNNALTLQKKEN